MSDQPPRTARTEAVSPIPLAERLAHAEPPLHPRWTRERDASEAAQRQRIRARFAALELALADPDADLAAQRAAARAVPDGGVLLRAGLLVKAERVLGARLVALRDELERRIALRSPLVMDAVSEWEEYGWSETYRALEEAVEARAREAPSLPSLDGVEGDFYDDPPGYGDTPWHVETDPVDDQRAALEAQAGIYGARRVLEWFLLEHGAREALFAWGEREDLLGGMSAAEALATFDQLEAHRDAHRFDLERLAMLEDRRDVAHCSLSTQLRWAREVAALGPLAEDYLLRHRTLPSNWSGT